MAARFPESLLPLLALRGTLGITFVDIALIVALFFVFELILSRLLFKLHIRDQPSLRRKCVR